jgi:hypothetical protein
MNHNSPNIARYPAALSMQSSGNPHAARGKTIGFCTPGTKFRRAVQILNRTATTTSELPTAEAETQNSKIPERQSLLHPHSATPASKISLPPHARKTRVENCAHVGFFHRNPFANSPRDTIRLTATFPSHDHR